MADETKAAADKATAERREKQRKEEIREASQAEEDARNAGQGQAAADPVAAPVLVKNAVAKPRDRQDERSAYGIHVIKCENLTMAQVLGDPRYLWPIQKVINRYDMVILHDAAWRWEAHTRCMAKNIELGTIRLDVIHSAEHSLLADAEIDVGNLTIVNLGVVLKYSVVLGTQRIKTGFDSREEAEGWLKTFKVAAKVAA